MLGLHDQLLLLREYRGGFCENLVEDPHHIQQSQQQSQAPLLAKDKYLSNRGSNSGITGLQRGKTSGKQQLERGVRLYEGDHPADNKVREEGGVGQW